MPWNFTFTLCESMYLCHRCIKLWVHSDKGLVFLWYFMFLMASVSFAFFVSSFFSR